MSVVPSERGDPGTVSPPPPGRSHPLRVSTTILGPCPRRGTAWTRSNGRAGVRRALPGHRRDRGAGAEPDPVVRRKRATRRASIAPKCRRSSPNQELSRPDPPRGRLRSMADEDILATLFRTRVGAPSDRPAGPRARPVALRGPDGAPAHRGGRQPGLLPAESTRCVSSTSTAVDASSP